MDGSWTRGLAVYDDAFADDRLTRRLLTPDPCVVELGGPEKGLAMAYMLQGPDYLELWKYFEDRADRVKEAMFNSVTWAVGFAAAVLGFAVTELVDFQSAQLKLTHPGAVVAAAGVGLVLCGYSLILVIESAGHIRRNWQRAERCRRQIEGLKKIYDVPVPRRLLEVWQQILIVVGLFVAGFTAVLVVALRALLQS